jgi:tRNA(Ile)-lysidine synthase
MNHSASNRQSGAKEFEEQVRATVRKYGMLAPGEHVLVAVSGGADSVALLYCLHALASFWPVSLTAAHLNHRIRGLESDLDEQFVRDLCRRLQIPLVCTAVDVPARAAARRQNLEEAAREARYGFLHTTADSVGAARIAVGHTLNDQAESVLLRLLRGSGSSGLAGIYPVLDGRIVRPLIEASRRTILRYLDALGASFREDSSNLNLQHRRNRIRHELIPLLEHSYNPRLLKTLAREADLAREVSGYLDEQSWELYQSLSCCLAGGMSLACRELTGLHPAMQKFVLRHAIREVRGSLRKISSAHIEAALGLAAKRSGRSIRLPGGATVLRQFADLVFLAAPPEDAGFCYELPVPGERSIPEAGLRFSARISEPRLESSGRACRKSRALLALDPPPPTLTIRTRHPGDRYGGAGHKKLKKLLIDARIPLAERNRLPVVVAGSAVVWIPGFDAPKSLIPHSETGRCVVVEIDAATPGQ